ncbi:MAG: hypothetical protein IPN95_11050 [Bacteroidetes bacterium]|nr:hypothetical protein [Bacteroidota bacterium]
MACRGTDGLFLFLGKKGRDALDDIRKPEALLQGQRSAGGRRFKTWPPLL